MSNWYDEIEKEDKYSEVQDANFEEKRNINLSDYPQSMIKAAKAMKSGYFDGLFSKKMNILKGAIVGGLIGFGIYAYTKKGKYLLPSLGVIGGAISGSMIILKSDYSKKEDAEKKDKETEIENSKLDKKEE